MKITNNLAMIEVAVPGRGMIFPALLWDDEGKHLMLFDAGYPETVPALTEAIKETGHDISQLTSLVLTHQDLDHIGGAKNILALASNAKVYAHEVDASFIQGDKTPTKLERAKQQKEAGTLPAGREGFYDFLARGFPASYVHVDVPVKDGQVFDIAGGVEVVFTPGHTPGHAAYYLQASKTMIVGDAANIDGTQLTGSNPGMTWDMGQADASLEKIKSFDMNGVISYHTGYLEF